MYSVWCINIQVFVPGMAYVLFCVGAYVSYTCTSVCTNLQGFIHEY
jgi:hypothetical protein